MRIDSSGNLLVGKTSLDFGATAGAEFRNADGRVFIGSTDGVFVNRIGSDGSIIGFRKDGITVGSIGSSTSIAGNFYIAGSASAGLQFRSDDILPTNGAGSYTNGSIDLGDNGARFRNGHFSGAVTAEGGVYLGGTGAANHLDDYETGTFLPTFLGDTSNPSVTYHSGRNGLYVKVGDIVHVSIFIEISVLSSSGSGGLAVGGLPFSSSGTIYQAGTVGYASGWDTNKTPTRCLVTPSNSKIALYNQTTADPRSGTTRVQCGDLDTQSQVYLQVSYRTS
jgi:hypothetical protein